MGHCASLSDSWVVRIVNITQEERDLIELAISNLEKQDGIQHCANAVRRLLFLSERTGWITEENLDDLVRTIYEPNPEWNEEMKARHFRHIKMALQMDPEALNEDVKEIFKREREMRAQKESLSPTQWVDVYYFARSVELPEFIERVQTVFDAAGERLRIEAKHDD
jgi:hypothetical protein